jgi:hypothetical protein
LAVARRGVSASDSDDDAYSSEETDAVIEAEVLNRPVCRDKEAQAARDAAKN